MTRKVVPASSGARWSLDVLRQVTAGDAHTAPFFSPFAGAVGGTAHGALYVTCPRYTRVLSSSARLRFRELPDQANGVAHGEHESHVEVVVDFTQRAGWHKFYDPDGSGPMVAGWWPAPEAPGGAATQTREARYRYLVGWNTTTAWHGKRRVNAQEANGTLLGHNGAHTLSVVSVDEAVGAPLKSLSRSEKTLETRAPSESRMTVHNLVLTDVTTNAGNPDYLKFSAQSTDASLKTPLLQFTIADKGEARQYQWTIHVIDTDGPSHVKAAEIRGKTSKPGTLSVRVNDPSALGRSWDTLPLGAYTQDKALTKWGTYTFDIFVAEVENAKETHSSERLDYSSFKAPYRLKPAQYIAGHKDGDGNVRRGHYAENIYENDNTQGPEVPDDAQRPYMSDEMPFEPEFDLRVVGGYLLEDTVDASYAELEYLNPRFERIGGWNQSNDPAGVPMTKVGVPHLDIPLYTFVDDDAKEPQGTYIALFRAADGHASEYRDHKAKRMLSVNNRPENLRAVKASYHLAPSVPSKDISGGNYPKSNQPVRFLARVNVTPSKNSWWSKIGIHQHTRNTQIDCCYPRIVTPALKWPNSTEPTFNWFKWKPNTGYNYNPPRHNADNVECPDGPGTLRVRDHATAPWVLVPNQWIKADLSWGWGTTQTFSVGTSFYQLRASYGGKTVKERKFVRMSVRDANIKHPLPQWASAWLGVPFILGSTPRQVTDFIGADCADLIVAAHNKAYPDKAISLAPITANLLATDQHTKPGRSGTPGDILLADYSSPNSDNPDGVFDHAIICVGGDSAIWASAGVTTTNGELSSRCVIRGNWRDWVAARPRNARIVWRRFK